MQMEISNRKMVKGRLSVSTNTILSQDVQEGLKSVQDRNLKYSALYELQNILFGNLKPSFTGPTVGSKIATSVTPDQDKSSNIWRQDSSIQYFIQEKNDGTEGQHLTQSVWKSELKENNSVLGSERLRTSSVYRTHELPKMLFNSGLVRRFPINLAYKRFAPASQGPENPQIVHFTLDIEREDSHPKQKVTKFKKNVPIPQNPQEEIGKSSQDTGIDNVLECPPSNLLLETEENDLNTTPDSLDHERAAGKEIKSALVLYCHICRNKYKYMGTLKRHLITKHDYFSEPPSVQ